MGGNSGLAARDGAKLATRCFTAPPDEIRAVLIRGMREGLAHARVPAALGRCMIDAVRHLRWSELSSLVVIAAGGDPARDERVGEGLGRELAPGCRATINSSGHSA
jgi:hypothetical protein